MNKIRFLDVLKRFFPLMVIYGVLLVVASYEIGSQNQTSGRPIGIQTPLSPEFSRLLLQLDETSHEGNFLRGIEAFELYQETRGAQAAEYLQRSRHFFELALNVSKREDREELYYYYAIILILMREPPKTIDQAVRDWKSNFPRSQNKDPRIYISEKGLAP